MADPSSTPIVPDLAATLLRRSFAAATGRQRKHDRVIPRHIPAAARFRPEDDRKSPTDLALDDLNATLILGFLDHLERDRSNSVQSRNARLSAIRSFLKYAAHQDLTALATIEHSLAIPTKRHDKAVLGFLTRPEMEAIIAAPDRRSWVGQRDCTFSV